MQVRSLGEEDPLGENMATHSSFLPGETHGPRSLAGYSPWGSQRVWHNWSDLTHSTEGEQNIGPVIRRLVWSGVQLRMTPWALGKRFASMCLILFNCPIESIHPGLPTNNFKSHNVRARHVRGSSWSLVPCDALPFLYLYLVPWRTMGGHQVHLYKWFITWTSSEMGKLSLTPIIATVALHSPSKISSSYSDSICFL